MGAKQQKRGQNAVKKGLLNCEKMSRMSHRGTILSQVGTKDAHLRKKLAIAGGKNGSCAVSKDTAGAENAQNPGQKREIFEGGVCKMNAKRAKAREFRGSFAQ